MEEFQEADVLWPDQYHHRDDHGHGYGHHQQRQQHQQQQRRGSSRQQPHVVAVDDAARSAPVGIPVTGSITSSTTTGPGPASWARRYCSDDGAASASASFVPPHEIAARRRCSEEERAASSVCVGHGRTLKGRDLRSVRTAVLRMTGFLES